MHKLSERKKRHPYTVYVRHGRCAIPDLCVESVFVVVVVVFYNVFDTYDSNQYTL